MFLTKRSNLRFGQVLPKSVLHHSKCIDDTGRSISRTPLAVALSQGLGRARSENTAVSKGLLARSKELLAELKRMLRCVLLGLLVGGHTKGVLCCTVAQPIHAKIN